MKREVAIKFVMASRQDTARRRLLREGRAAQSLASEHVVRVYDLGLHEDAPYIVMELLAGTDLAALVRAQGPLPVTDAVDYVLEACVAVAEAHAAGIIHRDLKPANLFVTRTATREIVKVLDFGISKVPPIAGHDDPDKTAEDSVLGTPHYASPEQLRNPTNIDGRADVWSLGVTLFYLLSGEHPFPGTTAREAIAATFGDPPRSLVELRPDVPVALWEVVEKTLAKRPEARTASVAELAHALEAFASKRGVIAAQKIAEAPPPVSPIIDAVVPDGELGPTTEESLSSTLSSTEAEALDRERKRAASSASRKPFLVAAAMLIAGAFIVAWQMRPRPEPVGPEPSDAAAATPSAPQTQADKPVEAPVAPAQTAEVTPSASSESPPPAVSAPSATARPARPAPAAPQPSQLPSATPSVAPVRRDIDGIPIVD